MNTKKIILTGVLGLLLVVSFALGRSGVDSPLNTVVDTATEKVEQALQTESKSSKSTSETTAASQVEQQSSTLTAEQKNMLQSFGIDPATVTVTAQMITCAEAKVGKARLEEIKNGATPSVLEGASLLACYK